MATYGDFSSLFQLGVGVGIGLSVFRAPIDLRISRIARALDAELTIVSKVDTEFARSKKIGLMDLGLDFAQRRIELERIQLPWLVGAVIGSLLNLVGLVVASVDKDRVASACELFAMLFITVAWFILLLAALEFVARRKLSDVEEQFNKIRSQAIP